MNGLSDYQTKVVKGNYLVHAPLTGAMSLFTPAEFLVFSCLAGVSPENIESAVNRLLEQLNCNPDLRENFSKIFVQKLQQQGWLREGYGDTECRPLQIVYLSVTTGCNLNCIYCYIGDDRRIPKQYMTFDEAWIILNKIKEFNPNARITVTGGEPFLNPEIFRILDGIEAAGFTFVMGTNATLIDEETAQKLSRYKNLLFIQASLDGITPEIHSITRGNTFYAVMNGIQKLIKHKIPLAIAPTIHEGNIHEIPDIARFAYANGGFLAPNHLRKFPHAPHAGAITLKPESLRNSIINTFSQIQKEFGNNITTISADNGQCIAYKDARNSYICGNGWYSADIDWNGDVYPCHLLREPEMMLGNIFNDSINEILARSMKSPSRVRSFEIPKCKTCPFVSTCGGGCRASAWFNQGTFAAEDEFCPILYEFETDKLLVSKGFPVSNL